MMDFITGLRQVIQDLLIPEFKALQAEVRGLNDRLDSLADDVDRRFEQVDRRFEQVDRRFEQVDRQFEQVHQEILGLTKAVASMDGKLDILVGHIVDYKAVVQLSVRVENLEKQVAFLVQRAGG